MPAGALSAGVKDFALAGIDGFIEMGRDRSTMMAKRISPAYQLVVGPTAIFS